MNVKTFDKTLGDRAKEIAAQVAPFAMDHRIKNNELNQRYQKFLLQQQQLATNFPIISQQLTQRKQTQIDELIALSGRDPENIKKTIEVLANHIEFFQKALKTEDDYLKHAQFRLEKLSTQAGELLAENSSALLKDQLSKLNEFEQSLLLVESTRSSHEQELTLLQTKVNETFLIGDKIIQKIKAQEAENLAAYQAIQANYRSVLAQEQEITITLSEQIQKLKAEKDKLFSAVKFEQLEIEQKDQVFFSQCHKIANEAFTQLDQLLSQRAQLLQENEKTFFNMSSSGVGEVFSNATVTLIDQREKVSEFSRVVKNMEQELKQNSQQEQIKAALEQTRLVLDQQVVEIEQAFSDQIAIREEQEKKLALSIASKIKEGQELVEQIDSDKEQHEWLVKELKLFKEHIELIPEDKKAVEVSLGDLAIRATVISQMLDAVEQERDLSKERLPVEINQLNRLAKEMLPRVSEYRARLQKILVDQQGARSRAEFALGLFDNWLFSKLPFVVELKKFIKEQKGLEKQIAQLMAMEDHILALSDKELKITADNLAKLSKDLIDNIVYLEWKGGPWAKGASEEILKDEIEKRRLATKVIKEGKKILAKTTTQNWLLAQIDGLAESSKLLSKHLFQVSAHHVICDEDQKTIGTAKTEQNRLAELSQKIQSVANEGQSLQVRLDKIKNQLTNLRTAKNIFSDQKTDWRYQVQIVVGKKSEPSTLILRVQEENIAAVKLLLQEKTNVKLLNVNAKDQTPGMLSRTALHYAVETGNSEMVKLLLSNGARIGLQDETGSTPLHIAVKNGSVALVKILLAESQHILRLGFKNQQDKTALDLAVDKENVELVKLLVEKGADLEAISQASKNKFLQRGVKEGDSQWVMKLLQVRAEISSELWLLALQGYVAAREPEKKERFNQIIVTLISRKAPVNTEAKDEHGNNILHLAAQGGHREALTALWSRTGMFGDVVFNSFNEKNLQGNTPLQVAIKHDQLAVVAVLVSAGVQMNMAALSTEEGREFLLRLAKQAADKQVNTESQQVLKVLLAREKEEKIHNAGNPTILFLVHELLNESEQEQQSQVMKYLVAAGAKIEAVGQDAEGNHVLHRMCRQGELRLVKELIGSLRRPGYLLSAQNELGETVLHAAMGDEDNIADIRLVEYLLSRDEDLLEKVNKEGKKAFETERGQRVFERVRDTRETNGERVYESLYQLLVKKGVESAYEKALEHELESLRRGKNDRKPVEIDEKESDVTGSPRSVQKIFGHYEGGTGAELLMVQAQLTRKDRNYLLAQNETGETLLHRAVMKDDLKILKFIKKQSKERKQDWLKLLNIRNRAGETALHVAVRNRKSEVAKWLLEEGIDKWQVDNGGQTAWSLTLEKRHVNLIRVLIGSGEMPVREVIERIEFSGRDINAKQLWIEVLKSGLFKHKETVVNALDRNEETLLHAAIKRKDVEEVSYLLSCRADVAIRSKEDKEKEMLGETAFELAQRLWEEKQNTPGHIVSSTVSEVKGEVKSLLGIKHEVEMEKEQKIYELLKNYKRKRYGYEKQKLLFTHVERSLSDLRRNYLLQLGNQTSAIEGLDQLSREGMAKRVGVNKELAEQVGDRQDASQNLMKAQDIVRKVIDGEKISQDPVRLLESYAGVLSKYVVLLNRQVLADQKRGIESKEYKEGVDLLFDRYELIRKELKQLKGSTEKVAVEFDKLLLSGQELEAIINVVYKDIQLLKNRLLEIQHEEKRAPWYRSKLGDLLLHRLVKNGELTRERWQEKNKEGNLLSNVINTPTLGNGYTALQLAIAYGASGLAKDKRKSLEMVQLLLEKGADVNAHQSKELDSHFKETGKLRVMQPALNIAVQVGNPWVFSCLLERKELDVNAEDKKGETALHMLASRKDAVGLDLTKLLLQANPNLDLKNKAGKTALELAKSRGNEEFVKLVQNVDKKRPSFEFFGPKKVERERIVEPGLISAIKNDALLLAKLLLERKELDVNISDKSGKTALHLLASRKDIAAIELLKLLLKRDANFKLPNKQGKTALQVAVECNNRDFVICCKEKDQNLAKDTQEITRVTDFFSQATGVESSFSGSFKELRSRFNQQKRDQQEHQEPRQLSNDDKSKKLQ